MTRHEAGFTLVEVLIAIALLGMLTLSAYSAVRFEAVSWANATAYREATADQQAVVRVMQQAIATAYPAFAYRDISDLRIAFDGSADSIALVAPLPEAIEAGVMAREKFYTAGNFASRALFMAWALDLPAAQGGKLEPHLVRLADQITQFKVAYFGSLPITDPPAWHDTWSGMTSLPRLVRVEMWRRGPDRDPWIDITVAPTETTNTACVYDVTETVCRRLE